MIGFSQPWPREQTPRSQFPYYSCLGRHSKRNACDLRSITFYRVEELIQELYDRLALRPTEAEWLEADLKRQLAAMTKDVDQQRDSLSTQKLELERKQHKLLEAHYNDAIPIDMLRTEQKRLDSELTSVTRELESLNVDLAASERHITMAIDLAQNAADAYCRAPDQVRRLLNQLLFERIEVRMDEEDDHRLRGVLAPRSPISTPQPATPRHSRPKTAKRTTRSKNETSPPNPAGMSLVTYQFLMPLFLTRAAWSG